MTKHMVLSKLFSLECGYSINSNYGDDIHFFIGNKEVVICSNLMLSNEKGECIYIEFCEIKEIKITDKTVTFVLQEAGYSFKDGDTKIIRRKQ